MTRDNTKLQKELIAYFPLIWLRPQIKRRVQQFLRYSATGCTNQELREFLFCLVRIRGRVNVCTWPLPSSGSGIHILILMVKAYDARRWEVFRCRDHKCILTLGKVFEKAILGIAKRHIGEKNLFSPSQFGFRARHSTTLQCMRLADHVTLKFNSNKSTAAVFLDIEKAFDTTWHPGLLYKLSKLQFSNKLSSLALFFRNENSESRWKASFPRKGTCKQGCHKVPSYPLHCTICI
jgi:hypothetical protein